MSAELVNFLQQVVAGNRDEAANIIKDQLDEIIHDFIFPGDAESNNDFGAAAAVDGIDNPFEDQAELPDSDLEGGFEDGLFDDDLDGLEGMEGLEDLDDVAESLDDDDAELLLGSADADKVEDDSGIADVDSEDTDLDLDALSDELGDATLSDIEDFDEVDGAAAKTVVAAEVDHNNSDGSVVPVKLIYSDGSDFEFYTLSDSADQVAQVLADILEVPRNDDDSDGPSGADISSLDDLDPSTDVSLNDVFESLTRRKIQYILD